MKRSFCFDIDGTLISTGGAGGRSFKKAIIDMYQKEPEWKKINMAGRLDPSIFNEILNQIHESFSQDQWARFKSIYLKHLELEIQDLSRWKVFDGVFEMLDSILSNQEKPFLLTGNIREGAWLKLKAVGLHHYFDWDRSVFGDEGWEKREELVAPLKKKHQDHLTIIIGDTPADILVGKLSGGISIAVATGMHSLEELQKHNPDFAVHNLKNFSIEHLNLKIA